jgi:hypothetical protein
VSAAGPLLFRDGRRGGHADRTPTRSPCVDAALACDSSVPRDRMPRYSPVSAEAMQPPIETASDCSRCRIRRLREIGKPRGGVLRLMAVSSRKLVARSVLGPHGIREPLVLGGHERSRSAYGNRRSFGIYRPTSADKVADKAAWGRVQVPPSTSYLSSRLPSELSGLGVCPQLRDPAGSKTSVVQIFSPQGTGLGEVEAQKADLRARTAASPFRGGHGCRAARPACERRLS